MVCKYTCLTCQGTSEYCKSCPGDYYLFENSCFEKCPGVIVDDECVSKCPDRKFKDNGVCKECDEKCETCKESETNCLRCANGYKSHNGDCLE